MYHGVDDGVSGVLGDEDGWIIIILMKGVQLPKVTLLTHCSILMKIWVVDRYLFRHEWIMFLILEIMFLCETHVSLPIIW